MIRHVTFGYLIHDELLSYKDAVIRVRDTIFNDFYDCTYLLRMHSKDINSNYGRKFVIGNGFSNHHFL